jgi:hypothetical protein
MTEHKLKIWPEYYAAVINDTLRSCARRNDRDYQVGDILVLNEWDPVREYYTGCVCHRRVTYVLHGGMFGIHPGYVVLSMAPIDKNRSR